MTEDILKGVGQLEGVNIAESELDVRIDNELRQTQNLSTQVEGVSEA